eukprot:9820429-Prorocentrum_lima.AAC.1
MHCPTSEPSPTWSDTLPTIWPTLPWLMEPWMVVSAHHLPCSVLRIPSWYYFSHDPDKNSYGPKYSIVPALQLDVLGY